MKIGDKNLYPEVSRGTLGDLKESLVKLVAEDDFIFIDSSDLAYWPLNDKVEDLYQVSADDVDRFVTPSRRPPLWVFRAICYLKLGLSVYQTDWFWYNM